MAKKFKEKEVIKYSYFQTKCDRTKQRLQGKGVGLQKKIKGQTLPQPMASNERALKEARLMGHKPIKAESVNHYMMALELNI